MHDSDRRTYIDFNRSGIPLVEIVTEADVRSPGEAYAYLMRLKSILLYTGVCNCNMEEGSLRCDVNVSVMPEDADRFGTKVEIKNLNSYRNVQRALEYEIERQMKVLEGGTPVEHETRLYNAASGETEQMRTKEEAHDYRYFPEPDLLPLIIDAQWIDSIRADIHELPARKKKRFMEEYGLPEYDADILVQESSLAEYFETAARASGNPKASSNWIMGDILRELKNDRMNIGECPLSPEKLAEMIKMIDSGEISGKMAKDVFEEMYRSGRYPLDIVKAKGLVQINDRTEIERFVEEVLSENPGPLSRYRSGKTTTFGFFVGQVMKKTGGNANPALVNEILRKKLDQEK
jgi:aspartyl-tRNA(Asn)/glutamyl-tRNA(Gln) amidotransferase subunit B